MHSCHQAIRILKDVAEPDNFLPPEWELRATDPQHPVGEGGEPEFVRLNQLILFFSEMNKAM